jgi:hypothetical protein
VSQNNQTNAATCSEEISSSPFMYGQLPITIERPAYAAPFVVARVGIGPNWHTARAKTPERAARWLRVRLAGMFAYGDAVKRGSNFAQASIAQGQAWRAQMARERESGAAILNCGGVGRKLVPSAAASVEEARS